jgi:tRNA (cytidine/uridine-2'-O-)-methyltransferase
MLHLILWEPEIPPNTGNIARLCAVTGTVLHLVGRLGFRLDERSLKRAGLDYWDAVDLRRHDSLVHFEAAWVTDGRSLDRIFCFSAHATRLFTEVTYQPGDGLLLGGETHGLPEEVVRRCGDRALCIPMPAGNSMPAGKVRSLNLATAAGIVLYEALRQTHAW